MSIARAPALELREVPGAPLAGLHTLAHAAQPAIEPAIDPVSG